jgi:hypothetical protein
MDGAARRWQDLWRTNGDVRRLALLPEIFDILRLLYRREPIAFQTLNFRFGSEQAVHSDSVHFHSYPARFVCGVWVALEDIDAENGPLVVCPGSHRLPVTSMQDFGLPPRGEAYPAYEAAMRRVIDALDLPVLSLTLNRGQAVIWAANLLHGGSAIRDRTRTRLSQATHYFFTDCLHYVPMRSDALRGRVYVHPTINIATGRAVSLWDAVRRTRGRATIRSLARRAWAGWRQAGRRPADPAARNRGSSSA